MQQFAKSLLNFLFLYIDFMQYNSCKPFQAPPKYAFKYGVNDYHTGDVKSQVNSSDLNRMLFSLYS